MELDFTKYLRESFGEDTSKAEKILQAKWDKTVVIMKEAFDDQFADKRTALNRIQHDFINKNIAPKNIDVDFLTKNMDYVVEKVNALDEANIKFIFNTYEADNKADKITTPSIEMESAKVKGKKVVAKKVPKDKELKENMDEATKEAMALVRSWFKGKKGKKVVKEDISEEDCIIEADMNEATKQAVALVKSWFKGKKKGKKVVKEGAEEDDTNEKTVKVTVDGTKVTVEPSEESGLEKSEHDFDDEEQAKAFTDTLKDLFKGFKVELTGSDEDSEKDTDEKDSEDDSSDEDDKDNSKEDSEEEIGVSDSSNAQRMTDTANLDPSEEEISDVEKEEEEDSKEETEDAGEELEDAGEEQEDAGEEPEDSDTETFNWEDIASGEDDAEEEYGVGGGFAPGIQKQKWSGMMKNDSVSREALVGKLVRVDEGWFNVTLITEDCEIVGTNLAGEESTFTLDDILEAEEAEENVEPVHADAGQPGISHNSMDAQEEIEKPEEDSEEEVRGEFNVGDEVNYKGRWGIINDIQDDVAYISDEDGNEEEVPLNSPELNSVHQSSEEVAKEETPDADAEECMGGNKNLGNEALSFAKIANRWMQEDDLQEALYDPTTNKKISGLTSQPGKIGQKIEKIPAPEKAKEVKGKAGNFTSKAAKPKTNIDNVSAPPKALTKPAPTGSFTKTPQKPKETVEKIKAPNIDPEYKKGGAKG